MELIVCSQIGCHIDEKLILHPTRFLEGPVLFLILNRGAFYAGSSWMTALDSTHN